MKVMEQKSVQQVGPSTTDRGPQEKPSLTSSALMIMVRMSWSKSLLGMKRSCTSTALTQKRNSLHGNFQGFPPLKNSRYKPGLGN